MSKKKLLFIIGSLKQASLNRMLAEIAAAYISKEADVSWLDYSDVPWINPDIEFPTPEAVARVREEIRQADGVWIFFPEYNHSYPGVLKNLLDWISRPVEKGAPRTSAVSSGVPVTYSSVSGKGGAVKAFEKMDDLMEKIHMKQMKQELTAFSEPEVIDGKLNLTEEQTGQICRQADAFLSFLQ